MALKPSTGPQFASFQWCFSEIAAMKPRKTASQALLNKATKLAEQLKNKCAFTGRATHALHKGYARSSRQVHKEAIAAES